MRSLLTVVVRQVTCRQLYCRHSDSDDSIFYMNITMWIKISIFFFLWRLALSMWKLDVEENGALQTIWLNYAKSFIHFFTWTSVTSMSNSCSTRFSSFSLCITSVYQIVFVTISSAQLFISCLSFTCILLWMSCSWLQTMSTLIFSFHSIPERFTPPLNVSVNCTVNPAGCTITWQKPCTSYEKPEHCFEYEINIQNKVKTISWFEFGTIPSYMYLHSMQCSLSFAY